MNDESRPYPFNKMEPDATPLQPEMADVYAGPEMMDDPLRALKNAIVDAGRYRSQPYGFSDLEGKTEEELRQILKAVNDMPVTMFEDRAYFPSQPPMMMVYAGPQQMSNGGFTSMFQQQVQPAPKQEDRAVVGYCHECGMPLYARSKFCPECGTQLKFLK